jgi:rhodanese-related sulfurtransferase
MKYFFLLIFSLIISFIDIPIGFAYEVKITPEIESITIMHNGREVTIERNQDQDNLINPEYAKTSRPCPPFCIYPMTAVSGVETVGVLEVIHYLKQKNDGAHSILLIDARTVKEVINGSIPGSVSIPWDVLSGKNSSPPIVKKLLEEQIGVKINKEGEYCFKQAKTLIFFCNGPWCDKSYKNIKTLLKLGYPSEKLKWFRGGMQSWESYGLTIVTDIPMPWLGL